MWLDYNVVMKIEAIMTETFYYIIPRTQSCLQTELNDVKFILDKHYISHP